MVAPRGASWRTVAFALFLLVALGFSVSPVAAYHMGTTKSVSLHISETVTLPTNNYTVYTFSIGSGDTLTYNIAVTSGSAIDMYIVPAAGLAAYESESAQSFSLYDQFENRMTIAGTFRGTSQNAGTDSVIVDNVDFSGAVPSGAVTVTVDLTRTIPPGPSLAVIGGILLAVVVVIALVAFLAVRARKKRAMAPPPIAPPAYPGPPGPYAPPPYFPPQPPPQGPYPPPPPAP
jgi:hypothetical protein